MPLQFMLSMARDSKMVWKHYADLQELATVSAENQWQHSQG